DFQSIDEYNDVEVHNYWNEHVVEKGEDPEKVLEILRERSRDAGRAPIPWDDSPNGGFTTGTPWLRLGSEYKTVNVKAEDKDPDSVLNFYRKLLKVRHGRPCIIRGETEWIDLNSDEHMSYLRKAEDGTLASLNNFTDGEITVCLPEGLDEEKAEILLSNCGRESLGSRKVKLEPWECLTAFWKA
ncbi:MAG: hypothetical protein Q4D71_06190, partial [Oscillospiraceae bacterium]|nr:hypothetical protein [Oscillospiraceae bacterium]